jgi:hypothetical protein
LGVGGKHNGLSPDFGQFIAVVIRDGEGGDVVNGNINIGGGGSKGGERVSTNLGSFVKGLCRKGEVRDKEGGRGGRTREKGDSSVGINRGGDSN